MIEKRNQLVEELVSENMVEIERTPKTTKRYQIKYFNKKGKLVPVNDHEYKHHVALNRLKRYQIKYFNKKGKLVPVNDHEYKHHVALNRLKRFQKRFKDQELQLVEAD